MSRDQQVSWRNSVVQSAVKERLERVLECAIDVLDDGDSTRVQLTKLGYGESGGMELWRQWGEGDPRAGACLVLEVFRAAVRRLEGEPAGNHRVACFSAKHALAAVGITSGRARKPLEILKQHGLVQLLRFCWRGGVWKVNVAASRLAVEKLLLGDDSVFAEGMEYAADVPAQLSEELVGPVEVRRIQQNGRP